MWPSELFVRIWPVERFRQFRGEKIPRSYINCTHVDMSYELGSIGDPRATNRSARRSTRISSAQREAQARSAARRTPGPTRVGSGSGRPKLGNAVSSRLVRSSWWFSRQLLTSCGACVLIAWSPAVWVKPPRDPRTDEHHPTPLKTPSMNTEKSPSPTETDEFGEDHDPPPEQRVWWGGMPMPALRHFSPSEGQSPGARALQKNTEGSR